MGTKRDHSAVGIRVAEGRSDSLAKCTNVTTTWGKFGRRLQKPRKDRESLKQFLRLSDKEQARLKAADGWVVGGPVSDGWRSMQNVVERDVIALDIDAEAEEIFEEILLGVSPICEYEFYLHTTRKHKPEDPRFRIFLLCSSSISKELYEPVTRILASKLDPSLDSLDVISFRAAQLMYFPTICRDSDWRFEHNRGKLVDAETVLDGFHLDWRDYSNLPSSSKRADPRKRAERAEDPLSKTGVIGAFCRAYSIEEAIEEFIPDKYRQCDDSSGQTRYTWAEGSVEGGAVVYDDGRFLYSNHDTDPAGHQNCNAFDLVRIHKFGALDDKKKIDEDTPITKYPSYTAMADWARERKPVQSEFVKKNYDMAAMFEDLPDEDVKEDLSSEADDVEDILGKPKPKGLIDKRRKAPKKPVKDWEIEELERDKNGFLVLTLHNSTTLIMNDPRIWGVIGLNEFTNKITARRSMRTKLRTTSPIVVEDTVNGLAWEDIHDHILRAILEAPAGEGKPGWGYRVSVRDIKEAVRLTAEKWRFHPIKEYYDRLRWDGQRRVETLFIRYLGLPDTPYARDTARLFLIANIARIYSPGHKWDHVPIISGPQGIGKSSFISTLFGEDWSGEMTAEMAVNKDAVEQMMGKQCLELPELANMRYGMVLKVKQFITLRKDEVRLSYDRRMSVFPRQCTFMGTSNEDEYLKDRTGNRRYWPLPTAVRSIDLESLAEERDQLWAEAYEMWRALADQHGPANLPLFLAGDALTEAERLQELAREEDSVESTGEAIKEWLESPVPLSSLDPAKDSRDEFDEDDEPMVLRVRTCPRQAYCEAMGVDLKDVAKNKSLEQTAGSSMSTVSGWRKTGRRFRFPIYGRSHEYVREDATVAELKRGYRIFEENDIL